MSPNIISHISRTPIPPVAWKRAGLEPPRRATLGECALGELYALCAARTETAEGLAFTRYAGVMVEILESYSVTVEQALSSTCPTLQAMTEDQYQALMEEWRARGWAEEHAAVDEMFGLAAVEEI